MPTNRRAVQQLALARLLSVTGSGAAGIALSAEIYRQTGSAVWLSATFFFTFGVAGLLNPLAGLIVDRLDRQRLMVASDVLAAAMWILLLLADAPIGLLLLGFLAEVVHLPFRIASRAVIPNMVEPRELSWANGLIAVGNNVGRLLGPAIGGTVAAAAGSRTVFLGNAVSFVVSALLVATVRARFSASDAGEEAERGGVWSGFAHLARDPVLRALLLVWTLLYLTVDVAVVADLPLSISFGWDEFGYGLMNAFWGAGALAGSILARRITVRFEPWAVLIGTLGIALGYGIVAAAPIFAVVLAGQFVAAGTDAGDEVAGTSIFQRGTPDHLRGRAFGAIHMAGLMANAVGFTFAGFLVEWLGARTVYLMCAVASALVAPLLLPLFRYRPRIPPGVRESEIQKA